MDIGQSFASNFNECQINIIKKYKSFTLKICQKEKNGKNHLNSLFLSFPIFWSVDLIFWRHHNWISVIIGLKQRSPEVPWNQFYTLPLLSKSQNQIMTMKLWTVLYFLTFHNNRIFNILILLFSLLVNCLSCFKHF